MVKSVSVPSAGAFAPAAFESAIALVGSAPAKEKLAPDAGKRNDGEWHSVDVPGGKVDLRFARWDAAGRAVYEAKGWSSTVPIQATSFEQALKRVTQLVRHQAMKPRPTLTLPGSASPNATTISAPSQKAVTVDLNDPSMRDGVVPKPWFSGKPGSYFLDPGAITEAKDRGNNVRIVDLSSGRGDKDLHAYVSLSNDARGGGMYALITASSNPPFKIPSNAGDAFNKGYADMQGRISSQQMISTVNDLAAAGVALKSGTASAGRVSRPRQVMSSGSVARPRSRPAPMALPLAFRRLQFRGTTTHVTYVMDKVGSMIPALHVNPLNGTINCLSTAVALDRLRAGRPAMALKRHVPYEHDVYDFYGRLPISGTRQKSGPAQPFDMKSLLRYIESLPRGARGLLLVSPLGAEYGHAMVIENVLGRAVIMDGQNGYVVNPKALSTGVSLGETLPAGSSLASMPDLPGMKYQFLRTDDVRNPGSALPKNVLQGIVQVADPHSKTVTLAVMDRNGAISQRTVDQSRSPGLLRNLVRGENVYLVDDKSSTVRPPGMLIIKQSDGQEMLKRIDSRQ
jgi:Papain fold toxin 1, glutamine deamidase